MRCEISQVDTQGKAYVSSLKNRKNYEVFKAEATAKAQKEDKN